MNRGYASIRVRSPADPCRHDDPGGHQLCEFVDGEHASRHSLYVCGGRRELTRREKVSKKHGIVADFQGFATVLNYFDAIKRAKTNLLLDMRRGRDGRTPDEHRRTIRRELLRVAALMRACRPDLPRRSAWRLTLEWWERAVKIYGRMVVGLGEDVARRMPILGTDLDSDDTVTAGEIAAIRRAREAAVLALLR